MALAQEGEFVTLSMNIFIVNFNYKHYQLLLSLSFYIAAIWTIFGVL